MNAILHGVLLPRGEVYYNPVVVKLEETAIGTGISHYIILYTDDTFDLRTPINCAHTRSSQGRVSAAQYSAIDPTHPVHACHFLQNTACRCPVAYAGPDEKLLKIERERERESRNLRLKLKGSDDDDESNEFGSHESLAMYGT